MIFDANDGAYLELTVDFLVGKRDLPASVESRFWKFDIPNPSSSGQRTLYVYLRMQWAVTYGFERTITVPEHDALSDNQATKTQFDVVTIAGSRQTHYRAHLEGFPALPLWIKAFRLPSYLCVRLPRSLLFFGSEAGKPDRFQSFFNRLTYVLRLEVARSIANALDLDFCFSHIGWIVSDEFLALLREFSKTPKVEMPAQGSLPLAFAT